MATALEKRERWCRASGHEWIESNGGTLRYCVRCKAQDEVTQEEEEEISLKGQQARVYRMISEQWTCGTQFLSVNIPRYAARLWELRSKGYMIERRRCVEHIHPQSVQYQWKLIHGPA